MLENGEWCDWYNDCSDFYYDDIDEYIQEELAIEDDTEIFEINKGNI